MTKRDTLTRIQSDIVACRSCPRLIAWCEELAVKKRRAYRDWQYWGGPVPSFGDKRAALFILGLAPAAHGANRTGRMFTGDRSGDWLYGSLHAAGLASQASSSARDDGLALTGAWITAIVRCAPPANRPATAERDECLPWLEQEIPLLPSVRVVVALGGFAWTNTLRALEALGCTIPRPRPKFGHGAEAVLDSSGSSSIVADRLLLLGSYPPSQQITVTGRLTREVLDAVWERAKERRAGG